MFRHLLVPTDGSPLSEEAVKRAVSFAKNANAQLTFFYAEPDRSALLYDDAEVVRVIDPEALVTAVTRHTKEILGRAQAVAMAEGVPSQVFSAVSNDPFEVIIMAAEKHDCDLILMASHGHRGLKGLLLGSQTQKVLTHSTIPVLVYR